MAQTGASDDFKFVARHEVLAYPEYDFDLEEHRRSDGSFLLAHLNFRKFTPSILKRVLREWQTFRTVVRGPIYAIRDDGSHDKWVRFITHLGFKPTDLSITCNNGAVRQLFISTVT